MTTPQRIHSIDALRGFALAGIVLVHMLENYIGSLPPAGAMDATYQGLGAGIANGIVFLFIRGKFFAIFSFLFGLSFSLQQARAQQKGDAFSGRFIWRLLLLFAIGTLHHLFYRGDILTIYAVLGLLLIPLQRLPNKVLLSIAALLFLGLGRYIIFLTFGDAPIFRDFKLSPEATEVINYFNTLKAGSLGDIFETNLDNGFTDKADFQLGTMGRAYLTLGFFLLGVVAARQQFFEQFRANRVKWRKWMYWSIGLMVLSFMGMGGLFSLTVGPDQQPDMNSWLTMLAFTFMDLWNFFMAAFLVIGFLLLYAKRETAGWLQGFAPYGRMALTNYFAQTLIGTFLLYGWGLGYLAEWTGAQTFLIGLSIIILQLGISYWWLQYFRYGPLEWVWRSLTYFRKFPLVKGKGAD
ncbi:MAG: DUF418 domain-containing protein [Bacteroidota bacterium]